MTRWATARFLVATAVVAAMLGGVLAGAGSAAVSAKVSESDCEALRSLSDNTPDVSGSGSALYGKQAAAAGVGFAETAEDVQDKKLRKAMQKIASVYKDLADADSTVAALTITVKAGKSYAKALARWSKANLECATANVTLPTIPSNITLPSGVTLPSLNR